MLSHFRRKDRHYTWLLAAAPTERFLGPKETQALEDKNQHSGIRCYHNTAQTPAGKISEYHPKTMFLEFLKLKYNYVTSPFQTFLCPPPLKFGIFLKLLNTHTIYHLLSPDSVDSI